jgi:hypothetical protein
VLCPLRKRSVPAVRQKFHLSPVQGFGAGFMTDRRMARAKPGDILCTISEARCARIRGMHGFSLHVDGRFVMHDSSRFSVTLVGLAALQAEGVSTPGLYTAKLIGWSDEETAIGTFVWLADAISWLAQTLDEGALFKCACIYSEKNILVWTLPGEPSGRLRESAMKKNAERILLQLGDECSIAPSLPPTARLLEIGRRSS